MIPSVLSEVENYRRVGRINQDAALQTILGNDYSIIQALHTPLDQHISYLIDACMYINTRIAEWISNGVTDDELSEGVVEALAKSKNWHDASGSRVLEYNEDPWHVIRYVVKCAIHNYNSRKFVEDRFDERCNRICNTLDIPKSARKFIIESIPYQFASKFISGMTDDEIKEAIMQIKSAAGCP